MRAQTSGRLYKQGKSSDSTHPPHTHTYTHSHPLTHFTNREGQPGPGRERWPSRPWGSRGLWPEAASGRGGEGGQDRVALRAILRLRARMTEQADILATENKSPRQHSRLPVPVAGVPEPPGRSSASATLHPSQWPPLERNWGGGDWHWMPPIHDPAHSPTLLSSLPVSRIPSATTCP